jgi:hypothetical protein
MMKGIVEQDFGAALANDVGRDTRDGVPFDFLVAVNAFMLSR